MARGLKLTGLVFVFALISLGVFVWPEAMLTMGEGQGGLLLRAAAFLFGLFYILIWFGVPLLLLAALLGGAAAAQRVTGLLGATIWLVGLSLPIVIVGASVGSTNEQFVMSSLKAVSLFLLVIGGREFAASLRNDEDRWSLRIAGLCCLALLCFSGWSLASAGAAIASAMEIAEGDSAYCIADTRDAKAPYRPIGSLFALRGVDLVVEKSGAEASARHYFHAVLYRPEGLGPSYWNWSASRLSFEPIELSRLSASVVLPLEPCDAKKDFLRALM